MAGSPLSMPPWITPGANRLSASVLIVSTYYKRDFFEIIKIMSLPCLKFSSGFPASSYKAPIVRPALHLPHCVMLPHLAPHLGLQSLQTCAPSPGRLFPQIFLWPAPSLPSCSVFLRVAFPDHLLILTYIIPFHFIHHTILFKIILFFYF